MDFNRYEIYKMKCPQNFSYMQKVITFVILLQSIAYCSGSIRGKILDAENRLPLEGANILVIGSTFGGISDKNGNFSIFGLKNGYYSINITYIGYESKTISDIWVREKSFDFNKITLNPSVINYNDITVTKSYFLNNNMEKFSSVSFNNDEIRRAPGSGQEITRILNSLPSVASTGENRQDMMVRGGGPTENGFIIDNISIPSISHFNQPDGRSNGPVGLINTEMVDNIEFYSNGFPAKFGDKLSSFGDIRYRDGKQDELDGNISLGFGGAGGLIEGPITKNITFIGSYRRSYLDLVSDAINAGGGLPKFDDFQMKVNYRPSHYDSFTILTINGNSIYESEKEESLKAGQNEYGVATNNQNTLGINHRHIWNKSAYSNTSISITNQISKINFFENNSDTLQYNTNDKYKTINGRQVNHIKLNASSSSIVGFEIQNRSLKYDFNLNNIESKQDIDISNISGFLTIKSIVLSKITLTIGSRLRWNNYEKKTSIAPRINIDLSLGFEKGNIILNSGKYFQNPPEKYLALPQNKNLSSIEALQHSLSYEKLISNSTKFSISTYIKNYNYAPMMYGNMNVIDPTFLMDQLKTYPQIVSNGKARTIGIEALVEKKRATDFYGLIGGSIFNATYTDQMGTNRDRNHNYGYILNIVGGYRPKSDWEVSARWSVFGNKPYTRINLELSNMLNQEIIEFDNFNEQRTPIYHNLFLRYEQRKIMSLGNLIFYFELWNAYNRNNVETYFWSREKRSILETTYFNFIPVGGFEIEF